VFDPRKAATIEDLRRLARRRLPEFAFIPMETGAGDGSGPQRNVQAFRARSLKPRVLRDVDSVELGVSLFGRDYGSPFGISAVGYAGTLRRDADLMLAEAAAHAKIPFMLSGGSNASIEQIARVAVGYVWQQLYAARDFSITEDLIRRARDAGVEVLVYTVDSPLPPNNDWLNRSGIRLPANVRIDAWPYVAWQSLTHPAWALGYFHGGRAPRMESWAPYASPGASSSTVLKTFQGQVPVPQTWSDLERIRELWPGKLMVKGIVDPGDAADALAMGVDAVAVSNHGGNKLDAMGAALDSLPAVAQAVGARMPVAFDGGIRRGSDIVASMALGAQFCFVGRATLYGVIAGGRAGADRAIQILTDELRRTLIHIGVRRAADVTRDFVEERTPTAS
jgi:(S)-mandelate dehydrogenase